MEVSETERGSKKNHWSFSKIYSILIIADGNSLLDCGIELKYVLEKYIFTPTPKNPVGLEIFGLQTELTPNMLSFFKKDID